MLDEKKIRDLLSKIIPELKKIDNAERQKRKINPVFYPSYPIINDFMERISIHAEIGKFPDKLFAERSPNQEEKEFNHVKKNYKQITLPIFSDYISTITRLFHDANWNIDYVEDEPQYKENTFQKYVTEQIKNYGSLENFVKFIISQKKAIDANGIIAVKPHTIFTKKNGEELIIASDKLTEPIPVYYSSKKIVAFKQDEYAMIMLDDKSMINYGGVQKKMGYKFEFYDDQNIWLIEQTGKFIDYEFSMLIYYNHECNFVPVIKLMGIPQVIEEEGIIWQSPFLYVTDILDIIALNHSNLQMSIDTCVYPYRVMIGDVCEWKDTDGNICCDGMITNKNNKTFECPSCHGTGLRSRISPLGTMLLKPKTRLEDGDSTFTQKPLEYISPQTTTLEFLENKIAKDEEKARKILHLQTSNSIIKGSENLTATGMTLDLKAMYAFIKTISDQTFFIWEFISNTIGFMRYGKNFKNPKFTYPITFDFVTESDIIAQLKTAIDGGLPPFIIHSIIYKYLQILYFNDVKTVLIFKLIVKTDRLLTLSNEQIALKVARGTVHDWEEILHTSAINFVNELIDENPNFLKQDFIIQKKQLIAKAKAIPCDTGECHIGAETTAKEDIDNMVVNLSSRDNQQ